MRYQMHSPILLRLLVLLLALVASAVFCDQSGSTPPARSSKHGVILAADETIDGLIEAREVILNCASTRH